MAVSEPIGESAAVVVRGVSVSSRDSRVGGSGPVITSQKRMERARKEAASERSDTSCRSVQPSSFKQRRLPRKRPTSGVRSEVVVQPFSSRSISDEHKANAAICFGVIR
eukprot:5919838-Prymnesium_polylepis.1